MDYIFNEGGTPAFSPCVLPRAIATSDSGCLGSTLVFTDGSTFGKRREWLFTGGTPATSTDSVVFVTYSTAGTYSVRLIVINDNGSDTTFTQAVVFPLPTANAGTDKTICLNSKAQIGDKPDIDNKYAWLPTTDLDNPSIANPNASPKSTTQYILTVTSEHGCIAYDTVLVTVGNIVAKVSNDTTICSGTSIQLLASGGAKYTWSPSTGLSDTTIENPTATPTKTTTYKVLVSSGTCEDSAFVTITVNPQPTANAGQDKTLCIGASTEIGEASQAGFTYQWQPTNGLDDATKANPTASPTRTTQYILTVSGNGGCTASDTVLVTIGTIKAIVSNDTSICEGASVKLFASGGAKYEWSPSVGLDNPFIATPTANPTSTTKYKVLVSSGACIDSAFVTVTILPPPNANAGEDKPICIGESTQIGTPAEAGNSYSWNPSTGLSSPNASQTIASPTTTTTYTLTVSNAAGCVKSDEVIVTVNQRNERSFTLQPDMVTILPGKQFTANLEIPSGVNDWSVQLKYDSLLVKFNSITGAQAIPDDLKGELLISGNGGSRSIPITFDAYLPHTSDTIYPVKLSVDTSKIAECETWSSTGNILMLADYCGKNIRVVSSTGKKYYLTVKDRSIDFGVGLSGNVRLEVFDYVGNSVLVVSDGALEAGEYSAGLDLPVGVYYCRMRAGMYESVGKVLIAR
ncbi:MAG: PKD domain-containing protein [Candidatus Kapaibacterium sp.]